MYSNIALEYHIELLSMDLISLITSDAHPETWLDASNDSLAHSEREYVEQQDGNNKWADEGNEELDDEDWEDEYYNEQEECKELREAVPDESDYNDEECDVEEPANQSCSVARYSTQHGGQKPRRVCQLVIDMLDYIKHEKSLPWLPSLRSSAGASATATGTASATRGSTDTAQNSSRARTSLPFLNGGASRHVQKRHINHVLLAVGMSWFQQPRSFCTSSCRRS